MTIETIKAKYGVQKDAMYKTVSEKADAAAALRRLSNSISALKAPIARSIDSFADKVIQGKVKTETAQAIYKKLESIGRTMDTYK